MSKNHKYVHVFLYKTHKGEGGGGREKQLTWKAGVCIMAPMHPLASFLAQKPPLSHFDDPFDAYAQKERKQDQIFDS